MKCPNDVVYSTYFSMWRCNLIQKTVNVAFQYGVIITAYQTIDEKMTIKYHRLLDVTFYSYLTITLDDFTPV